MAIIDSLSRSITSVSNYDTYDQDSTSLETLLLKVRPGDIVILLTFDEPSSKLSQVARLLLHELGSGKAQNLNYRTSWYLITQKGITGYSPYEEIHLPSYNASQPAKSVWGSPHDVRMCLPLRCKYTARLRLITFSSRTTSSPFFPSLPPGFSSQRQNRQGSSSFHLCSFGGIVCHKQRGTKKGCPLHPFSCILSSIL